MGGYARAQPSSTMLGVNPPGVLARALLACPPVHPLTSGAVPPFPDSEQAGTYLATPAWQGARGVLGRWPVSGGLESKNRTPRKWLKAYARLGKGLGTWPRSDAVRRRTDGMCLPGSSYGR